jgi:hypothetical protein
VVDVAKEQAMSDFTPPSRPNISRAAALEFSSPYRLPEDKVFILGRRGYYEDSMGVTGQNDINIYDDAACIVTPERCIPYNFNTDPSVKKPGEATLDLGRWLYKLGIHGLTRPKDQQYEALVQAATVDVHREGTAGHFAPNTYDSQYGYHRGGGIWKGMFGINIHRGGEFTSTGSAGCQTVFKPQWGDFIEKVKATMEFYKLTVIPYILTEHI